MARKFVAASSHYLESGTIPYSAYPVSFVASGLCVTTTAVGVIIGGMDSANANRRMVMGIDASNRVFATVHDGTGSSAAQTTATVTDGVRFHAAATFAGANSRKAYLNGGNMVETTGTRNLGGTHNTLAVGRRSNSTPADYFDGLIEYAAVWTIELTAAEIYLLYLGVSPLEIQRTYLKGYWPLYGLTGFERDLSGWQRTLTVNGAQPAPALDRVVMPREDLVTLRWPRRFAPVTAAAGHPAMRRFGLVRYQEQRVIGVEGVQVM